MRNTSPFTAALFEAISLTRLETSSEGDKPPFSTCGYRVLLVWDKFIWQLGQFNLVIWTNTFHNLDKYILQFGKMY